MISEATDIPRLQVCCHISSVKTELYFWQVLGRILRVNGSRNQHAWLFTFAEQNLIEFSERIEQDIPESCLFAKFAPQETYEFDDCSHQHSKSVCLLDQDNAYSDLTWGNTVRGDGGSRDAYSTFDDIRLGGGQTTRYFCFFVVSMTFRL